jgi:hypothetical protein
MTEKQKVAYRKLIEGKSSDELLTFVGVWLQESHEDGITKEQEWKGQACLREVRERLNGEQVSAKCWIIRAVSGVSGEKLWWSNEIGWVDKKSATRFTEDQTKKLNLPMGGEWEKE